MNFARLTLWLGEVCTDDTNANANDNNAGRALARRTKHDCL